MKRFAFFVFGLSIIGSSLFAAEQPTSNTIKRLQRIESDLAQIQKSQQAIMNEQDELVKEIKNLKVWVNRHP